MLDMSKQVCMYLYKMVTLFDNKYKVNFGRLSTELDDLKFRVMNHDVEILAYYIQSKNIV